MAKSTILNSVEEVIEDFRNGRIVIVVDDEDRENEGDFIVAAEKITPEIVNFMLKEGRGVLCAPLSVLGDLFASIIKRQSGVKDFGHIMPGHGGIMDRFDSMMFVLPVLYILVQYVPLVYPL